MATIQGMSFHDAMKSLYSGKSYQDKEVAKYDLRRSNVRQNEIFRGYIYALNLARDSDQLLRKVGSEIGVENYVDKLDQNRHKIVLAGNYDALIALGGSFMRLVSRLRCEVNDVQMIKALNDILRVLVRALVDFKRSNGVNMEQMSQALS